MNLHLPKNIDDNFIRKTFCLIGIDNKTGARIDFIFSFSPYEKEAIKRAKIVNIAGIKVRFATVEDLIIHKLFAKRERDIEDVRLIIEKHKQKLNIKYIKEILNYFVNIEGCEDIVERFNSLVKK
jgi:predicted nucleotidyltransferase